jgi:hypothetical protein
MIRNALLLCAGILVATALACAPAVAPPPPPFTVNTVNCTSPAAFAASVQTLSANFVPNPLGPPASAPPPGGPIANPNIIADLTNAFALAPPRFRNHLCGAGGNPGVAVFIQDCLAGSACVVGSWGYRQRSTGARFIALSAGLWQTVGIGSTLPYTDFETAVLANLLGGSGVARYQSASNNSPEMTVLAALAHEMGHILLWDGTGWVMNKACPAPHPGLPDRFWQISWRDPASPPPFHRFGDEFPGARRINPLDKDRIRSEVLAGQLDIARNDLQQIYSGEWASLLANVAPDEDLIESYKLFILNTANNVGAGPLTSLTIAIPSQPPPPPDVIRQSLTNGTPLFDKRRWINACLP